jgi:hypothetical protein
MWAWRRRSILFCSSVRTLTAKAKERVGTLALSPSPSLPAFALPSRAAAGTSSVWIMGVSLRSAGKCHGFPDEKTRLN